MFKEIKEHIKNNSHVIPILIPACKQKGAEIYFDAPSYNSWSYNVKKGVGKDFRTEESTDIIEIYRRVHNLHKNIDAAKAIANHLNISVNHNTFNETKDHNKPPYWQQLWDESVPLGNTIAETYLRKRNINLLFSSSHKGTSLRYMPNCYHSVTKKKHPILIAALKQQGKLVGVHRHYLSDQGEKLFTDPEYAKENKKMLGTTKGAVVELGKATKNKTLIICEGVESGLSLMQDIPNTAVWCALSAYNMSLVTPPMLGEVNNIQIRPDIEPSNTGQKCGQKAAYKFSALGYNVTIKLPIKKDV